MTSQEHYSLRWNNHQNHILDAFDSLLRTKSLVDVTLVCSEKSIYAHKVVLSACSPFFKRVFCENPCKHPVIVLKDFSSWVVQAIVEFMYRGEISVPQRKLRAIIDAGESLQVRGLVDHPVSISTPTPAATPDDYDDLMDNSLLSIETPEPAGGGDYDNRHLIEPNNKIPLPTSQLYLDGNGNNTTAGTSNGPTNNGTTNELCTSPLPRRKQARPRRRSGEGGPHDLSQNKTPDDNEKSDSECDEEIITKDDELKHRKNSDRDIVQRRPKESESSAIDEDVGEQHNNDDDELMLENDEGPENLCTKKSIGPDNDNNNSECLSNNNTNDKTKRIVLSMKDIRHINKPTSVNQNNHHQPHPDYLNHLNSHALFMQSADALKREALEHQRNLDNESPFMEQMDLSMSGAHQPHSSQHDLEQRANMHKEFTPSSPMSLPSHFNPPDGPPHPPSPLQFPSMASALALTPPHMFGLESSLGLFPPGMDPGKLYNPLMEMSDPRGLHPDHHPPPFLKKKLSRAKGQHSAPRGGPPRSWTNAELTEALSHVWNKKMTTSQASRIFGIPYNSLLMYVRGKYGKSLKLEQLRKDCISGPPVELITMGISGARAATRAIQESGKNRHSDLRNSSDMKDIGDNIPLPRSSSSEPDLMSSPNAMFNPFPPGFYPDFAGGFPGLPLSMLNLLPPDRHQQALHMGIDEDCKSDRSKHSLDDDYPSQPLALNRDERREICQQNGQD